MAQSPDVLGFCTFLTGHFHDFARPLDPKVEPGYKVKGSITTSLWSQSNGGAFKLAANAYDNESNYWKRFVHDFNRDVINKGEELPKITYRRRPPACAAPHGEEEVKIAFRDQCTQPIHYYALDNWVPGALDIPPEMGFPMRYIEVEELYEATIKFAQTLPDTGNVTHPSIIQPPKPTKAAKAKAVKDGERAALLRVDCILAASAAGDVTAMEAYQAKVRTLRAYTAGLQKAEVHSGTKYLYLRSGETWMDKENAFSHFKPLVVIEFKAYGMLRKANFEALAGKKLNTELPEGTTDGPKNLLWILRQTVHYCIRYGTQEILLADYESMGRLVLEEEALDPNGVATNRVFTIQWRVFSTTEMCDPSTKVPTNDSTVTGRYVTACSLWNSIQRLKRDIGTMKDAYDKMARQGAEEPGDKGDQPPPSGTGSGRLEPVAQQQQAGQSITTQAGMTTRSVARGTQQAGGTSTTTSNENAGSSAGRKGSGNSKR